MRAWLWRAASQQEFPAATLAELVRYATENPGKLTSGATVGIIHTIRRLGLRKICRAYRRKFESTLLVGNSLLQGH
jgi:hypothetical protein